LGGGVISFLIIASVLVFSGCSKEKFVSENKSETKVAPEKSLSGSEGKITYYLNGIKEMDFASYVISETSSFVALDSLTVYVFDNDRDLLEWASSKDGKFETEKQIVTYKCAETTRLRAMAIETGLIDDEAATLKFAEEYNKGVKASGHLWTQLNYAGTIYTLFPTNPIFPKRNPKIDNNTMSFIGGATTLFDYRWYGGAKAFLLAGGFKDLGVFNFNNRASSAF